MTNNDKIDLQVEVNGRQLRCFQHEGKTFIESREETVYALRVKNKTNRRIKAVISVDSLNIVSGKTATNDPKETGYILQPHEEQLFKGYRVDNDTVAEFKFVKREKSYATELGSGAGNGVIAIRAYEEKENDTDRIKKLMKQIQDAQVKEKEYIYVDRPYPVYPHRPWYWDNYWYGSTPYWGGTIGYSGGTTTLGLSRTVTNGLNQSINSVGCSAGDVAFTSNVCGATNLQKSVNDVTNCSITPGAVTAFSVQSDLKAQAFDMGSGWGSSVKDTVREVEFEEGECIAEIAFYYASRDSLKIMGIDVERIKAVAFPEPFKREFCARPSGWKA